MLLQIELTYLIRANYRTVPTIASGKLGIATTFYFYDNPAAGRRPFKRGGFAEPRPRGATTLRFYDDHMSHVL
jgi:hypothetical protein